MKIEIWSKDVKTKACPHCGGTTGYYKKFKVSGIVIDQHDFNGNAENSNMHDSLRYVPLSCYQRCRDCDKIIKEL